MAARDIIEKLKNRDESGMEELLQHYGPLMRYVIRPFLSDERDPLPEKIRKQNRACNHPKLNDEVPQCMIGR